MDDSSPATPQNCKKFVKQFYWLISQGTFFPLRSFFNSNMKNKIKKIEKKIINLMSLLELCFSKFKVFLFVGSFMKYTF